MKIQRLLLPIFLAFGLVAFFWLSVTTTAQANYFLYPVPSVNDYQEYPNGSTVDITPSNNGLIVEVSGNCGSGTGSSFCGVDLDMGRTSALDVQGLVVDFVSTSLGSEVSFEHRVSPSDIITDVIGAYNGFFGDTPATVRNCRTNVDSGDISHLGCDYTEAFIIGAEGTGAAAQNYRGAGPYLFNSSTSKAFSLEARIYWLVLSCPDGSSPDVNNICQEDEPPPPPSYPYDPAATCSFNYTGTITTTTGTTGTATYSYTVPANLVQNWGFETADAGGFFPQSWTFNASPPPLANTWWGDSGFIAKSGTRYLTSYAQANNYQLLQDMTLYSSGRYMAGAYVRPHTDYASSSASLTMRWSGAPVVVAVPITNTWHAITGTRLTSGGSAWLGLYYYSASPGTIADIHIDDIFIFPVEETGDDILCDPAYYPVPPGQPVTTTIPTGNCTYPIGNTCYPNPVGTTCWQCELPDSWLLIGQWISWLLCQIRNLFLCHLWDWIQRVANIVMGVFDNIYAFVVWVASIPNTVLAWIGNAWNAAVNWLANIWANLVSGIRNFFYSLIRNVLQLSMVQTLYNLSQWVEMILSLGSQLITWFLNTIRAFVTGIVDFFMLIIDLITAVVQAFFAPSYDWSFVPGASPDGGFLPGDLGGDGPTPQKILWLFLLGLGTLDASLGDLEIAPFQFVVIGLLSIGLILWTLKKWDQLLPA